MHPFGGTPVCPRCEKAVYAAEQAMGPGRRLYHKPCLACMSCHKRLDSYSLVEHNQEPYCKPCHIKNFGTRDLRSANLSHREEPLGLTQHHTGVGTLISASTSPPRPGLVSSSPPQRATLSRSPPPGRYNGDTYGSGSSSAPRTILPTRALSPDYEHITVTARKSMDIPYRARSVPPPDVTPPDQHQTHADAPPFDAEDEEARDTIKSLPTNSLRAGDEDFPRTSTLTDSYTRLPPQFSTSLGRESSMGASSSYYTYSSPSSSLPRVAPLIQTATGTRYGAGLMMPQATGGTPRTFGGVNPKCPRCDKSVYFAEQIKAVGKTWHKACLRCTECNTTLDSTKLTDKDGEPFCRNCYGKLHGPAGRGYALLGKAGG